MFCLIVVAGVAACELAVQETKESDGTTSRALNSENPQSHYKEQTRPVAGRADVATSELDVQEMKANHGIISPAQSSKISERQSKEQAVTVAGDADVATDGLQVEEWKAKHGMASPAQSCKISENHPKEEAAPVAQGWPTGSSIEIDNFHMKMGKAYEDRRLWDQAEQHYLLAGQGFSLSPASRQLALERVERVRDLQKRQHRFSEFVNSSGEAFDKLGAWLLRFFVAVVVLSLLASAVLRFRNSTGGVEISAFSTPADEKLGNQIGSSFLKLRSKLLAAKLSPTGTFLEIMIPIDPGPLSDLSFEAGGLKLSSLWRLLVRPRFRVTGGGHNAAGLVTLYAEIWRRQRWFGSRLEDCVFRDIPTSGSLDVVQLESFVYAVFLKILYAPR